MNDPQEMNEQDLYLEPRRHRSWVVWAMLGAAGLLLLGVATVVVILGAAHLIGSEPTAIPPHATLVPTYTPLSPLRPGPQGEAFTPAPATATLSTRPWTDDRGPVGLVEVTLSVPDDARVSHEPPSGFRYWSGDLVHTRQGLAWTGSGGDGLTDLHWYLFREPGASLPTTLQVGVNDHTLAVTLQPGLPAASSVPLE